MGIKVLILAAAAVLGSGAGAPPPDISLPQILATLERGDARQAESLSGSALARVTTDARTRARLLLYHGLAAELLSAPDRAIGDLTSALEMYALPPDEEGQAHLHRALLHEALGQPDEAIKDYGAVIALKSYSAATAFNNRGNIYLKRGMLREARQDFLGALAADGGQAQYAYYGLGRLSEMEGDERAARGYYDKAVAIDATFAALPSPLTAPTGSSDGPLSSPPQRILLGSPMRSPAAVKAAPIILLSPSAMEKGGSVSPAVPPLPAVAPGKALVLRSALDQSGAAMSAGEVQLGAWRSAAEAYAGWAKAKARAGDILGAANPHVMAADIPGRGRYFRLRVHAPQGGTGMCARLAAKKQDCVPVRSAD